MPTDFFVYWKNRLHRPETFAADYCQGPKRPAILGFGGEWRCEKDDPDDVLDELLVFVAEDAQFIPGLNINLVKETRALVIPKAKAESLARATRSQAESAEHRWRGAAWSDTSQDWQQSSSSSWWSSSRDWGRMIVVAAAIGGETTGGVSAGGRHIARREPLPVKKRMKFTGDTAVVEDCAFPHRTGGPVA